MPPSPQKRLTGWAYRFESSLLTYPAFAARKKISLEEAGRKVRYALLRRHARILGATRIATGHTLDDQVETYLMRIIRGTGPLGPRRYSAETGRSFHQAFPGSVKRGDNGLSLFS